MKHLIIKYIDFGCIGIIIIAIIQLINVIGSISNFDYSYLQQTGINWKQKPIIRIENKTNKDDINSDARLLFANSNDSFRNSNEENRDYFIDKCIPLISDYWPGTIKGCYCKNTDNNKSEYSLTKGMCYEKLNNSDKSIGINDNTKHINKRKSISSSHIKAIDDSNINNLDLFYFQLRKINRKKYFLSNTNNKSITLKTIANFLNKNNTSIDHYNKASEICTNIDEVPKQPYLLYENSYLCSYKQNLNYFSYEVLVDNNDYCPLYFKPCGVIDTMKNILCVRVNEKCPISGIKIIKESELSKYNANNSNNTGFNSIKLNGNDKVLIYNQYNNDINKNSSVSKYLKKIRNNIQNTNNTNEEVSNNIKNSVIYSSFKFDFNTPCRNSNFFNNNENNGNNSESFYLLEKYDSYNTCPLFPYNNDKIEKINENSNSYDYDNNDFYLNFNDHQAKYSNNANKDKTTNQENTETTPHNVTSTDDEYTKLDVTSYYSLLNSNNIINKLLHLPEYSNNNSNNNNNINLYAKPYIGVSSYCYKDLSKRITSQLLKDIENINLKIAKEKIIVSVLILALVVTAISLISHFIQVDYTTLIDSDKELEYYENANKENEEVEIIYNNNNSYLHENKELQDTFTIVSIVSSALILNIIFSMRFFLIGIEKINLLVNEMCVDTQTALIFNAYYSVNDLISEKYLYCFLMIMMILLYKLKFFLFI